MKNISFQNYRSFGNSIIKLIQRYESFKKHLKFSKSFINMVFILWDYIRYSMYALRHIIL